MKLYETHYYASFCISKISNIVRFDITQTELCWDTLYEDRLCVRICTFYGERIGLLLARYAPTK